MVDFLNRYFFILLAASFGVSYLLERQLGARDSSNTQAKNIDLESGHQQKKANNEGQVAYPGSPADQQTGSSSGDEKDLDYDAGDMKGEPVSLAEYFNSPAMVDGDRFIRPGMRVDSPSCSSPPFLEPYEFLAGLGIDPSQRLPRNGRMLAFEQFFRLDSRFFRLGLQAQDPEAHKVLMLEAPDASLSKDLVHHQDIPGLFATNLPSDLFRKTWSKSQALEWMGQLVSRAQELGGVLGVRTAIIEIKGMRLSLWNGALSNLESSQYICKLNKTTMVLKCEC